jgi:hypothetical protein
MHELALYGQLAKDVHHRALQQLAGFTRMQPQDVKELHVVLKARQPPGLDLIQSAGGSGMSSQQQQELQRIKTMLNAGLYYVRLIGEEQLEKTTKADGDGDATMVEGNLASNSRGARMRWVLEFKDTPEAGKQSVSSRVIARIPLEAGNLMRFLHEFGYE